LVYFSPFWNIVPRKIWHPWLELNLLDSVAAEIQIECWM
jgi:hypothetical protein